MYKDILRGPRLITVELIFKGAADESEYAKITQSLRRALESKTDRYAVDIDGIKNLDKNLPPEWSLPGRTRVIIKRATAQKKKQWQRSSLKVIYSIANSLTYFVI